MDDTDLRGLDLASAKAYIFEFLASAKSLAKEVDAIDVEAAVWKKRVGLAESAGRSDLAQAASAKLAELEAKKAGLRAEKAELEAKVRRMREQLPMIASRERSIDADRLLAELQLMTGELLGPNPGEAAATEAEFKKLEASSAVDSELEALKRKAAGA